MSTSIAVPSIQAKFLGKKANLFRSGNRSAMVGSLSLICSRITRAICSSWLGKTISPDGCPADSANDNLLKKVPRDKMPPSYPEFAPRPLNALESKE